MMKKLILFLVLLICVDIIVISANNSLLFDNNTVFANNDFIIIDEDTYLRYNVVANDSDIDNDGKGNFDYSSLAITEFPKHGKAYRNSANGEVYYFPDKDFYGKDSLKYRICDTGMEVSCDEAWLYITVTPVNDPPVATHLVLKTPMNPVGFDYLAQVADVDNNLNPVWVELPSGNGKVSKTGNQIIYTPERDYSGIDEFKYAMKDSLEARAYVIVTVIVGDTLSDFQAQNDSIVTPEDTPVYIDVLANDTLGSESPDPRTVQLKVFPENGVTIFDPEKEMIVYTPDQDFNGTDSLTYIVSTGPGNWSFASVLITVTPVSDPFAANDDYAETKVDVPVSIDISTNDPDNRIDKITVIAQPRHGSVYVEPNGLMYIPIVGFTGVDTLVYGVCDTHSETFSCDSAKVIIVVTPEEKMFFTQTDIFSTHENIPIELIPSPLINDENINGIPVDPESFNIISGPNHGSQSSFENTVIYTPEPDYFGPDWMQYIVSDQEGNWDMAEINIWVNEVNDPPIALNDTAIVTKNSYHRIFILENDYDTDGTLKWSTLKIIGNPTHGMVQIDKLTGSILYKPSINMGFDSFTYEISDNDGAPTQATVYITIELETTLYIYTTTPEDTPVTIDIARKMSEYNLNFTITDILDQKKPKLGQYTSTKHNQIIYSSHDLIGKDTIFMQVWSANHAEGTAYLKIFITITPVNDFPVAIADTLHWFNAPDTLVIPFNDILCNDYDVDGDNLLLTQFIMDVGYNELHVEFNTTDSTITITSDSIEWCNAWFTYEIKDQCGKSTAKVIILSPIKSITNITQTKIKIYPNPTSNIINIIGIDVNQIEIFNISGLKVLISNTNQVDVSGLVYGTYITKIIGKNNEISINKFIKN
jgi:hypothetical protein